MDLLISNAARALAAGDPLAALNQIALRSDATALALRGIAMAQLGDFGRASLLLRAAASSFGHQHPAARARCVVAEAEVALAARDLAWPERALAARDLAWPERALAAARDTLRRHGDDANAAHAASLIARRQLLMGRLDDAEHSLENLASARLPAATRAILDLIRGGVALRRIQAEVARAALERAAQAARLAGIPALLAEVDHASQALDTPAARLIANGQERVLRLEEVEALLASPALIVDACRHALRQGQQSVALASRPVLFTLARQLAEAWPGDVTREALIARAFRTGFQDDTHRARLRVEIGRLRAAMAPLADVVATKRGYLLKPEAGRAAPAEPPSPTGAARQTEAVVSAPYAVCILARPVDTADRDQAAVLACLADGQPWSSSALSLALGASQRTVQRTLDTLAASGQAQPLGKGRARRWTMPPVPAFTTSLLLPGLLSDP